jgi:quercetin dioxygenase-like cupin family protein
MLIIAQRFVRRGVIRSALALLGLGALAAAFYLGSVAAQQPAPATKVSQLMKQTLADVPGREVMMITLDIPPGGGSPAHRHPGAHNFGYVLEGAYKIKLETDPSGS